MAIRGGYRLVPWWCRRAVYRPIVTRYTDRLDSETAGPSEPEPSGHEHAGRMEQAEMSATGIRRDPPAPVNS